MLYVTGLMNYINIIENVCNTTKNILPFDFQDIPLHFIFYFYKNDFYKNMWLDFGQKFKNMLECTQPQ